MSSKTEEIPPYVKAVCQAVLDMAAEQPCLRHAAHGSKFQRGQKHALHAIGRALLSAIVEHCGECKSVAAIASMQINLLNITVDTKHRNVGAHRDGMRAAYVRAFTSIASASATKFVDPGAKSSNDGIPKVAGGFIHTQLLPTLSKKLKKIALKPISAL